MPSRHVTHGTGDAAVVSEDAVGVFREGLARLLTEAGHEVVAEVGDTVALADAARGAGPRTCVADVRMPPGLDADGAEAAVRLRDDVPDHPVLLLYQHVESQALGRPGVPWRVGLPLKDRVLRVDDVGRVAAGGSALDLEVVSALIAPARDLLGTVSDRERNVLAGGGVAVQREHRGPPRRRPLTLTLPRPRTPRCRHPRYVPRRRPGRHRHHVL